MVKPYKDAGLEAGTAVPTGFTTTYRVVASGSEAEPRATEESPQPPALQQWLRRRHPADVLRLILMAAAVVAVILATLRLG